jgi:hypothetical protein
MSRDRLLVIGLVFVLLSATAVAYSTWKQSQREKREAAYESVLRSYSVILRPGMTRREIEDYLNSKGTKFLQMDRTRDRSAVSDIVKIGTDPAPWYCSEYNVYVAFQFKAVERRDGREPMNSDILERTTIYKWLEGCL